jgi:hypothetical protein
VPDYVPFDQFRDQLHDAKLGAEVDRRFPHAESTGAAMAMAAPRGASASKPARRDAFAAQLEKVLAFLRRIYSADGSAAHTFHDQNGNFVDCIPFEQVPTVRAARAAKHAHVTTRYPVPSGLVAEPEKRGFDRPPAPGRLEFPLRQGLVDRFGKRIACPDGCVPTARTTPDDMVRFGTFEQFFSKPSGLLAAKKKGRAAKAAKPKPAPRTRRKLVAPQVDGNNAFQYAVAVDTQGGPYFGCTAGLSIRQPGPPDPSTSISQFWMLGDIMASGMNQTIESGWMVQTALSHTASPVLFVFFNVDGYVRGGRSGYVTDPAVSAGFVPNHDTPFVINQQGFLIPPAADAKNPTAFLLHCEFFAAPTPGWYLYVGAVGQKPADYHPLGYFPAAYYAGTTLEAQASEIRFGGEVGGLDGVPDGAAPGFTEMGSGIAPTGDDQFNYHNVAFQCNTRIQNNTPNSPSVETQLQALRVDSAAGFGLRLPSEVTDASLKSYFFFGGRMDL